jgi:hypothetical protein
MSSDNATPLPPVFHSVDEMYPLEGEALQEVQTRYDFLNEMRSQLIFYFD